MKRVEHLAVIRKKSGTPEATIRNYASVRPMAQQPFAQLRLKCVPDTWSFVLREARDLPTCLQPHTDTFRTPCERKARSNSFQPSKMYSRLGIMRLSAQMFDPYIVTALRFIEPSKIRNGLVWLLWYPSSKATYIVKELPHIDTMKNTPSNQH